MVAPDVLLPVEIIDNIISFIPHNFLNQPTLWACALVSRAWYSASIGYLYRRPYLNGYNFDFFVSTICPSKNAHIRASPLAALVRRLDMGELGHNSSRSLIARLMGRLKVNLEEFVAPQVSFAINSFAALGKCTKLRYLNLSLISASLSNRLLFNALKSLTELETLFFPRTSSYDRESTSEPYTWPPRLRVLHLAGGVDDEFLFSQLSGAPLYLSRLSIQHCPRVHISTILFMLSKLGDNLRHLTIRHPMPQLSRGMLDNILILCPFLITLRVTADYISDELFKRISVSHTLQALELECSPTAEADVEITPNAIYDAIDQNLLPNLRRVRVSSRLAWDATPVTRADAKDLSEILEAMENENPLNVPSGVWWNLPDNQFS